MSGPDFAEISDRQKMFYEGEAKYAEITLLHFRTLATIAATEIGFLIGSMTLAGTNRDAKLFVAAHAHVLSGIAISFLVTIILGTLQGRWLSLAVLHGNRASFLPAQSSIELQQLASVLTRDQATQLEKIVAKGTRRNKLKSSLFIRLNWWAGVLATATFVGGNATALWLILKLTTG
jgi:hypothetical protein